MKKQTKVERTNKSKLDPRHILALRVELPKPVTVFDKTFQKQVECTTGSVAAYYGKDQYLVLVRGNSFYFQGSELVDRVIC